MGHGDITVAYYSIQHLALKPYPQGSGWLQLPHLLTAFKHSSRWRLVQKERPSISRRSFHWKVGETQWQMILEFLTNSGGPPGVALELKVLSFPQLNLCPSNCCQKWTTLVHLLLFWVSFLHIVQRQRKVPALTCRYQPVPSLHGDERAGEKRSVLTSPIPDATRI